MVLKTLRRILVAVVLCVGVGGLAAAPAVAATASGSGASTEPFTPPYRAVG
jgi:hypothetical protein